MRSTSGQRLTFAHRVGRGAVGHRAGAGRACVWGASVLAGVMALSSAGSAQAAGAAPTSRPGYNDGFVAVSKLGSDVSARGGAAMSAPAPGTVFVLAADASGQAVVERIVAGGRAAASRTRFNLGVRVDSPGGLRIDGTSASDVWASVNGGLWRFTGRGFTPVSPPRGVGGVKTVTDVPGSGVYVATDSGVYRGNATRGAVKWQSLGSAQLPNKHPLAAAELRVVQGRVFGMFDVQQSALLSRQVYEHTSKGWQPRYVASRQHSDSGTTRYAWLTPKATNHLILGDQRNYQGSSAPYCQVWRGKSAQACTTGSDSGVAAALADGRVVTDAFAVRDRSGKERALAGYTGDATVALAGERGTNTAWALTVTGGEMVVQRYRG